MGRQDGRCQAATPARSDDCRGNESDGKTYRPSQTRSRRCDRAHKTFRNQDRQSRVLRIAEYPDGDDSMSGAQELVMGVDIGGTKIAVGLVDAAGRIVSQGRAPMVANGTAEEGLQAVTKAIDSHWSDKVR